MINQNIFHPVNVLLYERTVIAHLVCDLPLLFCFISKISCQMRLVSCSVIHPLVDSGITADTPGSAVS